MLHVERIAGSGYQAQPPQADTSGLDSKMGNRESFSTTVSTAIPDELRYLVLPVHS